MDRVLEAFPEPIAVIDSSLTPRVANPAWQAALGGVAGAPLRPAVAAAAREVLAGARPRAEVDAPPAGAESPLLRWTIVRLPGDGDPLAMIHARAPSDEPAARPAEQEIIEELDFLRQILDMIPMLIFVKDRRGQFVLANRALAEFHELTVDQMINASQRDVHDVADEVEGYLGVDRRVITTMHEATLEETLTLPTGEVHWLETTKRPIVRPSGEVQVLGVCIDITERKRAQAEREQAARELEEMVSAARREAEEKSALALELDRQLSVIQAQSREIAALSAPILDVGEGIIGVPLIGVVDDARAEAMMERLLATIADRQIRGVILELSGLESVDERAADRLARIVRAIELLGARPVISGVRPSVATAMVALGIDLSTITTMRATKDAIRLLEHRVKTR